MVIQHVGVDTIYIEQVTPSVGIQTTTKMTILVFRYALAAARMCHGIAKERAVELVKFLSMTHPPFNI